MKKIHPLRCGTVLAACVLSLLLPACGGAPAADSIPESSSSAAASSVSSSTAESGAPAASDSKENSLTPGASSTYSLFNAPKGEIITVNAFDGVQFDGRLVMPPDGAPDRLVIYVNGSGPNTYENRIPLSDQAALNYHDLFAQEVTKRGGAYFSYNTRGVSSNETPPQYREIHDEEYQTYLPTNEIQDIRTIVRLLKEDPRLQNAKVFLLGWSAGTITAPLALKDADLPVDALLLAGYCNRTMDEILDWQQTGGSSMVFYRRYFDYDGDGAISKSELEEDRYEVAAALGGLSFTELDADANGVLDAADFGVLLTESREALLDAINRGDDEWLRQNYAVRLTAGWFQDYRNIPPNSETLMTLDLPIYIFQGQYDANTPAEDAAAIEDAFQAAGKTNLSVQVFSGHDHDLNFLECLSADVLPAGLQALLDTVGEL